ncbi:MAG: hypothetical protein ABUL69_05575 [Peristeroidobacter soli]
MRSTNFGALLLIAMTGALFACKKAPPPAPVAQEEEASEEAAPDPTAGMIEACTIRMAQPEANEWTTYWDTAAVPLDGEGPSSAHSEFWANDEEKKLLNRGSTAMPLSIRCSADGPPVIAVALSAFSSTEKDIPFDGGEYAVVGKAAGGAQPGQFLAAPVMFGDRMFEVTRGTINVDRFDSGGVRGRFRLEATETGESGAEAELEGTFDIPCRGGPMEGACDGNRTVR